MFLRAAILAQLLLAAAVVAACSGSSANRQAVVAARGAAIMPFDLSKTHHVFEQGAMGGVESVVAIDPRDATQIGLIRSHLRTEAEKFASGDFSDPTAIHGQTMPGVAALAVAGARLATAYGELPAGASITYSSEDRVVVAAIHDWFTAQLSDHGQHASAH